MREIALACHPESSAEAVRAVRAFVERDAAGLRVSYRIEGVIGALRIPAPRVPARADRLWEHTCAELFLAWGGPRYEEFNFSPSGEWAAFAFVRYREGAANEDVTPPRIAVRRTESVLELEARTGLRGGPVRLGLSAVIEARDGGLSYWALRHAPGKPDFHHREAFALELE